MPHINVSLDCPVNPKSFKVSQVAGMFGLAIEQKSKVEFSVEVPGLDEKWDVFAIVGPSGSGKSSVGRIASNGKLHRGGDEEWPKDKAIIECFGKREIKDIVSALTSVGLSSAPAWVRPYHVLSNGEKFRCDLARALLSDEEVVWFDEFTSLLDRTVAFSCCTAVAKAIRSGRFGKKRLVAISCHYDILAPLECDCVLDMATRELARGRLRRPEINLEIVGCSREAWNLFAPHHYLDPKLHQSAACYMAVWNGDPVAFCAVLQKFGHAGQKYCTRIVTLPDYQGVGIGGRMLAEIASHYRSQGFQFSIGTSHPGMMAVCEHQPNLWVRDSVKKFGNSKQSKAERVGQSRKTSLGRPLVTYRYVGK